ncbi:MAG: hemolysin family protein [Clostridiaceae bacterium]
MDANSMGQIILLIVLLFFSALFSASETALMSLSKIRVRHMVESKVRGAKIVSKMIDNPNKLLSGILIGNNIVNIGASALATKLAMDFFGAAGVGIATAIMTVLVLIFGEITPKSLAANNAEKVSLKVSRLISMIIKLLNPIIIILTYITNFIIRMLSNKDSSRKPIITEEELKTMVDVSHEEGILELEEKQMIQNVFEFNSLKVKDVMTKRQDIVAVDIKCSYEQIKKVFIEEQFSRIPVYDEDIDNIVGMLYVKDLFYYNDGKNFKIEKYIRDVYYTFESKPITQLFSNMQKNKISMSVVLNEYGGTEGIITTEDLVEEIIGEIVDEYDEHMSNIESINDREFVVKGTTRLEEVKEVIGINLQSKHLNTISGYVIDIFGKFPKDGESIEQSNIKFIVEESGRNRIEKLRLKI